MELTLTGGSKMDIEINVKMTVKGVAKEVVEVGAAKDCMKILITESLGKNGYKCEISDIFVNSVQK
jgi:hypothetical protein